jgi:putative membrane protein
MKFLRTLLTLLIVLAMLALGILFALQNKQPVPLDLLVYTFEPQSLALWVLCAFALGGLLGLVMSSLYLVRMRASLAVSKRELGKARVALKAQGGAGPAAEVA